MKLHAAILTGPNGSFAVLRAQPGDGEEPISDDRRRALATCFKDHHNNMPVAFLVNEPAGMRLIGYEDATRDLEQCARESITPEVHWQEFAASTMPLA